MRLAKLRDSTLEVAEAALAKLDATNLDDDWYFSMELVEEDELRIIRSDPHRDKYEKRAVAECRWSRTR